MQRLGCTLMLALVAVSACTPASSGEARSDEQPAMVTSQVPEGTTMVFATDRTISTDENRAGDQFTASLQSPILDAQGNEALPAGTPARWVVTESSTEGDNTVLAVQLGEIQVEGEWKPLDATVTNADVDVDEKDSDNLTAAKIAVGVATGAILGKAMGGGGGSAIAGAGMGAAVGTAVALSTRGGSAVLPAGSLITVQLDGPLVVS